MQNFLPNPQIQLSAPPSTSDQDSLEQTYEYDIVETPVILFIFASILIGLEIMIVI